MPPESAYLTALVAGALLCALAYGRGLRKRGHPLRIALAAPALALVSGFAGARLFHFLARSAFLVPMYGWGSLFALPYDGLALGGAVIGILLSIWVLEKALRLKPFSLLDPLAPAGMLLALIARLSEYAVSFGQGAFVENAAHQFFPLAVMNEWEEWYYAVFMLEALIALCCLVYSLMMRKSLAGRQLTLTLTLFMLGQIFAESLRAESLKWGFVRVHQLFAVLAAAAVLAYYITKARRQGRPLTSLLLRYALPFLLGVAALIGLEFAFDKWEEAPNWALYIGMAAVLVGMGSLVFGLSARTVGSTDG